LNFETRNKEAAKDIIFRPGTKDDTLAAFMVFEYAITDLVKQMGLAAPSAGYPAPATLERHWNEFQTLFEHLTDTAEQFWVAEKNNEIIGYARSILCGDLRELTEFFVQPGIQSSGVGRELLSRAFPAEGARRRCIIATIDPSGQALYLRNKVYPRFPLYSFGRKPEAREEDKGLIVERMEADEATLATLAMIDQQVLDHRRDANHRWLLGSRQGYLYRRNGRVIGYGYVGKYSGPMALLDDQDFPAVLAHAETAAAAAEQKSFDVTVPLINTKAVDTLLERGYRLDRFFCHVMTDQAFGQFENYIATSPMFFL
jgi:GNAT superfamily N-acetyltransferase